MKVKIALLTCVIFIQIFGCKNDVKNPQPSLPRNLNDAIEFLDKEWNVTKKTNFKNSPEQKAVASLHFSTGLWIRNAWVHGDRDTALVKYFNKIGIFAADDISSIILTSFHRMLNHKNLDLNAQVQPYKLYWKSIAECEARSKNLAVSNYNKYLIGSSVTILMVVDTSGNQRNAVVYNCPSPSWKFDAKKDLVINGIVTGKYFINSKTNTFLKVKINKMNYPNTAIFMNIVKIGDVEDFSLDHLVLK